MRVARLRHIGLVVAASLVAAPGASAQKPVDPGVQGKKQDLPAVVEPASPEPVADKAPAKVEPKVETPKAEPKGQAKKVVTAPAATTTPSATRSTPRRTRRASRAATRQASARSNRSGAVRGTARADQVRAENERREAARDAAVARRAEARRDAKKPAPAPAVTPGREDDPTGGLAITRAAEEVVEVIPGAVLLTLTGLGGLVLLLVLRSWAFERRRTRALRSNYAATVQALATAIEAKDHTTGGHIERVRDLGLLLAGELGLDAGDPQMAYGFLLHDVGKLSVPDAILRKPGSLDAGAWAVMRRHPAEGVRILEPIPFLGRAMDVVKYHHERWDGSGYPHGLAGEEIPLWARIFSVVDALDAMTADRPYQRAVSYADALEEIQRHAGTQFDPAVVEALARIDHDRVEELLEPAQMLPVNGNGVPLAELPEPAPPVPVRA